MTAQPSISKLLPIVRGIQCVRSRIHDPFVNLAIEDWLLRKSDPSSRILFLYRNTPSIVLGRNQNPWKECRSVNQLGIPLVRRQSGGGTVYHDLGNTNYSMLVPREEFTLSMGAQLAVRALHQLDIPAEMSPRHDVHIHGRKVSGSAYRLVSKRAFHHGTMLIDSNLSKIDQLLHFQPQLKANVHSKAVPSVRAKVTRLREHSFTVDHLSFCEAMAKEFYQMFHAPIPDSLWTDVTSVEEALQGMEGVQEMVEHSKTPDFTHTVTWDDLGLPLSGHVTFSIHRAHIGDVHWTPKDLSVVPSSVQLFLTSLRGERYHPATPLQIFDQLLQRQRHTIDEHSAERHGLWLRLRDALQTEFQ